MRFFSPPEKPTFSGRFSISVVDAEAAPPPPRTRFRNSGVVSSFCPRFLRTALSRGAQERQAGDAGDLHRVLEGEEHALGGALVGLHLEQALAVPEDVAVGDLVVLAAGQHVGERRLARAVGAHDRVHLALGNASG